MTDRTVAQPTPTIGLPPTDLPETEEPSQPGVPAALIEHLGADALDAIQHIVPAATYRIQFTPEFGFKAAANIASYLADLGVSHLYASPYLKARPGSTHGYDVTDYTKLNPELGSERDYDELVAALQARGIGQVCDFVPNHMGIGLNSNEWWLSVLEHGRCSPYGEFFDIDWTPLAPDMRGRVLLPFLGDQYGIVLERGELQLRFDAETGQFFLDYYENSFPIAPHTYPLILRQAIPALEENLTPEDINLLELQSIIASLERLPGTNETGPEQIAERQRESLIAKRRLADLCRNNPIFCEVITQTTAAFNGTPGDPASFDRLDQLLEAQVFRLAFWRVAAEEINYRRFFAINELAAIRQEEPAVFETTHQLVLALLAEGRAHGLRIDHVDGLLDPTGYLQKLQRAYLLEVARRRYEELAQQTLPDSDLPAPSVPQNPARTVPEALQGAGLPAWEQVRPALNAWLDAQMADHPEIAKPFYLLVEKILEHGERLPSDWPIHGTTGYEFANAATGLFVDSGNRKAFDELYAAYIGERRIRFDEVVYQCKRLILRNALASELNVLVNSLDRIASENRRSRDFTPNSLREALREVIACFPIYRTYVRWDAEADAPIVSEADRQAVEVAVTKARRRNPQVDPSIFQFVRDVLLVEIENATPEQRRRHGRFAAKVQQLSGPVMAKGLEDTAFYRYFRLTSLNEVGGDPSAFGTSVAAFHQENAERLKSWPHAMLASSTHDTKRSEDVRARISVLSELPREWRAAINRWARFNRRYKTKLEGDLAPDRNDEYLIYQTILGAWPFEHELAAPDAWQTFVDRMVEYALKAVHEAQVHSSWVNPTDYDTAVETFIRQILSRDPSGQNRFLADVQTLQRIIANGGMANGLSQQLLKLTVPGVPDIYQGTELWDFSLVDPDNRRPVDYATRVKYLRALQEAVAGGPEAITAYAKEVVSNPEDGRIKLWVTQRALALRTEVPDLFSHGSYQPLRAEGLRTDHVVAFARRWASDGRRISRATRNVDEEIIVVVPRLVHHLTQGEATFPVGDNIWGSTTLIIPGAPAGRRYANILSGDELTTVETGQPDHSVLPLAQVLGWFPVALLRRITDRERQEGDAS